MDSDTPTDAIRATPVGGPSKRKLRLAPAGRRCVGCGCVLRRTNPDPACDPCLDSGRAVLDDDRNPTA